MHTTTLSPNYQVSIPENLCQRLSLRAGQEFTLITKGNILVLVPTPSLEAMRGFMKGANGENYRDRQSNK
ncbi:AbrB/MazE/SpoVT family DNA-binding domain-containing protein [Pseudanabaena sp. FACHB-1277]|jgi:bifunctional DNA-binding transcriptional regulator/antitoxin component of YhaV-PrlF toxin-antitoxin module|uniref:AbrB/MazE/SpoVT family DNA-binding domain-containing protein n=1 Tax=Pseudanabaena cinerea FACHB-1277 TaxID=2949581 RepID=A0A926UY16_9CYAN|nr:AbrB/MazE/SpoVT family DNA-binding domain-containing protein [Pseudanabaena cinerea]MBD2152245.1 AbrB/MazE/SpoVT family DNA-binding domain-containing protein [Pseudanabaena cinerea FACHB-1277]